MFERYTESARRALFFARYESSELGSRSIETEHLLLGLLRDPHGIVAALLARAGAGATRIRTGIEHRAVFREKIPTSVEIPFGEDTVRALRFAADEADRFQYSYIGTEHLLIGLLGAEGSTAAAVLATHGLRLAGVRGELTRLLEEAGSIGAAPARRADAFEEIAEIKRLVDLLASMSDRAEAQGLRLRIQHAVDGLKRHLS